MIKTYVQTSTLVIHMKGRSLCNHCLHILYVYSITQFTKIYVSLITNSVHWFALAKLLFEFCIWHRQSNLLRFVLSSLWYLFCLLHKVYFSQSNCRDWQTESNQRIASEVKSLDCRRGFSYIMSYPVICRHYKLIKDWSKKRLFYLSFIR